jgi:RNA polymerase sigma-70 factor, ECF subfamily
MESVYFGPRYYLDRQRVKKLDHGANLSISERQNTRRLRLKIGSIGRAASGMTDRGTQSDPSLRSQAKELFQASRGEAFGLTLEAFARVLEEITTKYVPSGSAKEVHAFCAGIRVEELALARACAAGHERAWEVFLTRYRAKLYDIANHIAREASAGRELADSLYADLYGTALRDGQRVSKLSFYTGRGSLEGWLRTVLAQEYVNRYRRQRRLVSLDEEAEEGTQFAAANPEPLATLDPRVEVATDEAIAELSPEDKFVLAAYYLDSRTLAEIGRMLRVHESTISRKLDKLAKLLRKRILSGLEKRGMSRRQAQEALEVDVRDLQLSLREKLQETAQPPFSKKKAEAPAGERSG